MEPLPADAGHAGLPQGVRGVADATLQPAAGPGDGRAQRAVAQRHQGGAIPRRRHGRAAGKARQGAGSADAQPVLSRLLRRGGDGRRRGGVPRRHRQDRLPARPRRHSRGDLGAHRAVLPVQPRQSAGRDRRHGLSQEGHRPRPRARFRAGDGRVLLRDLRQGRAAGRARGVRGAGRRHAQRAGVPLAVEAVERRRDTLRLRRRRSRAHRAT